MCSFQDRGRALRKDTGVDGGGNLTRIFVETVHAFYAARAALDGHPCAKTGSVTVVQRASSDMRLNPHLHAVVLDGAWYGQGGQLRWEGLGHMKTTEVGAVLERTVKRIGGHLQRRDLLGIDEDDVDPAVPENPENHLAASAVSGRSAKPPLGGRRPPGRSG